VHRNKDRFQLPWLRSTKDVMRIQFEVIDPNLNRQGRQERQLTHISYSGHFYSLTILYEVDLGVLCVLGG
jgi:hypothetical protein